MKKFFLKILGVLLVLSISSLYAYNNQWSSNEDYVVPDEVNVDPGEGSDVQDVSGSASSQTGSSSSDGGGEIGSSVSAADGPNVATELNTPNTNKNNDDCPARTASPVYASSGHFTWTEVDVQLPGKSGIFLSRSYSSKDPISGFFGNGWISNMESGFIETLRHVNDDGLFETHYVYRKQNGLRYTIKDINGTIEAPSGLGFTIETISENSFKAISSKGTVETYVDDLLISKEDIDGNKREYVYDDNGVLEAIKDANGNKLSLTFGTNGYVTAVTDQNSRTWKFTYDENGSLSSVSDPLDGKKTYSYETYQADNDAQVYYHLTKISDETDKVIVAVTYESGRTGSKAYLNGRVKSYTQGEDTFTYNWDYLSYYGYITKTNSLNNWTRLYPAENGQIVKYTDVYYKNFLYNVDENMTLRGITDKNGNEWNQSVDTLGRVTSITTPLGRKTLYTYEGSNPHPSSVTRPSGAKKTISFNATNHPTTVTLADGSVYKTSYDSKGNILDVTNPSGKKSITTTYNANSQPLSVANANNDTVTFTYNTYSQIATMTDAMGNKTSYSYDLLGNLSKVVNAQNSEITYVYDAAGRLISLTDPAGNTTTYEYDDFARLSKVTRPSSRVISYTYNSANQVTKVSDSAGRDVTYTYDGMNRITKITSGSSYISYLYNAEGQITRAYDSSSGQYVYYAYDADGKLTQEKQNNQAVDYTYDLDGYLATISAKGTTVTYTRNKVGEITSVSDGENTFNFTYDANGMRKTVTYPNGLQASSSYDDALRLSALDDGVHSATYTYNKNGMLTQKTVDAATTQYDYDEVGRVTQAGGENFTYSVAGNIQNNSSVYDTKTNQLTSNATYNYEYDAFGNLVKKTDKVTGDYKVYTWNAWSKLTKVESFSSDNVSVKKIEFTYGPMGRRLSKNVDGVIEKYLYAGMKMVAIMNNYSTLKYSFMYDDSIDKPLSIVDVDAGNSYYYHRDYLGSVVALSDADKNIVESYTYDAYGKTLKSASVATGNPFAFTSREMDDEDLYFYRARYYDPTTGRFLSEDPMGFHASDFNFYRYVLNNPVNFVDPFGYGFFEFIGYVAAGAGIAIAAPVLGATATGGAIAGGVVYTGVTLWRFFRSAGESMRRNLERSRQRDASLYGDNPDIQTIRRLNQEGIREAADRARDGFALPGTFVGGPVISGAEDLIVAGANEILVPNVYMPPNSTNTNDKEPGTKDPCE